jgi:hypothetical protein
MKSNDRMGRACGTFVQGVSYVEIGNPPDAADISQLQSFQALRQDKLSTRSSLGKFGAFIIKRLVLPVALPDRRSLGSVLLHTHVVGGATILGSHRPFRARFV